MTVRRVVLSAVVCTALCWTSTWVAQAQQRQGAAPVKIYNTAKQKLMAGSGGPQQV